MPILYLLNYVELSYSETTFTHYSFDSKSSALPNFFQIDRIDEFAENDTLTTYCISPGHFLINAV